LIVAGSESPVIPNPLPEAVATFTLRSALPLFVNWTLCVLVWPTVTFPKLSDVGETARRGPLPFPFREIDSGEFEAVLESEKLPATVPGNCGAN
jgi:hypothetical protein